MFICNFFNSNVYLIATPSSNTRLLGLGNYFGVYIVQNDNIWTMKSVNSYFGIEIGCQKKQKTKTIIGG
jgi:hypothetical protein